MSIQPHDDLLTMLRSNLRRIDEEHRDEDLTPEARELKQLLVRRIALIEAAMENLNNIIRNTNAPQPGKAPDKKP